MGGSCSAQGTLTQALLVRFLSGLKHTKGQMGKSFVPLAAEAELITDPGRHPARLCPELPPPVSTNLTLGQKSCG